MKDPEETLYDRMVLNRNEPSIPPPVEVRQVKYIYLAGPMRGHADHNRPAFNTAAAKLRDQGHRVFNPSEADSISPHRTLRQTFSDDTRVLCDTDAIALLPGWETSKGAMAEFFLARAIGLEVMFLE